MTVSCVSSSVRVHLAAGLALLLAFPGIASTALGQDKSGSDNKNRAEYLNYGVYRITILAYYGDLYRPTRRYQSTGVLVQQPSQILTTRIFDTDTGEDLYKDHEIKKTIMWVCEQEPDPVRVAADKRKHEDSAKDKDNKELERFKDTAKPTKGPSKQVETGEERIRKSSSDLAERDNCVPATVRRIDDARNLVLIEAKERLEGGVPSFNVSDPEVGNTVRAFGYPSDADNFATRRSTSAERTRMRLIPTITTGTVVKTNTDAKDGQIILHQVPVSSGAWGGPLVNNCNEVVGLNMRQPVQTLIRAQGDTKLTGKNTGQVEVAKVSVPTSSVVGARGAKELHTFAEMNGIKLNVNTSPCTASLATPFDLKQNMWTLFIGGSALLLAAASMVVALRRPGPVRNTVAKIFPSMNRPREAATLQSGYGGYGGTSSRETAGYMPEPPKASAANDAYSARPSPSAARAEPTNIMPSPYAAGAGGGAKLVPVGGGSPISLDTGRLAGSGLLFGREKGCDLINDNSTVSKQHARITRAQNGKLQVEDLGSANGTWRGRNRVQRETFGNGDVIRFGSVEYRVELATDGGVGSTQLMTPTASWLLSGFDEEGRVVQWQLQPILDASGRQVETNWIIGRNSDRADKVLADKRVSGEHAKIRFTPQRGLEICDLGSSNGTLVDGRKISDSFVAIDDARAIEFGGSKMSLSKK